MRARGSQGIEDMTVELPVPRVRIVRLLPSIAFVLGGVWVAVWPLVGTASGEALPARIGLSAIGVLCTVVLGLTILEIVSVELTSSTLLFRRWGRRVEIQWSEARVAPWRGGGVRVSDGQNLVAIVPMFYRNGHDIIRAIESRVPLRGGVEGS